MKNTIAFSLLCCNLAFMPLTAQQMTAFEKVGQGEESVQEFFPGEHRARPVMGAYTDSERMGLFSGGQDLGGSSGWYTDTRWGDLGDGTFANPILNGDYSDPDVIRVGRKYYMTCSEFHFMGMNILESDDMVNWKIIGRIFDRMDLDGYSGMNKYGNGSWAPALRYHDGKFWMYVCTPNEGLFMSTATDPAGPWSPLYQVKNVSGWEDPCPLWDEDGQAYIGRSQLGGGPIIIHKMSADGKTLLDDGRKVYEGPTAEGTKLFLKDGYYYISIPEGGVGDVPEIAGVSAGGMADRDAFQKYLRSLRTETRTGNGLDQSKRPASRCLGRHARGGMVVLPLPVHRTAGTRSTPPTRHLERRIP